MISIDGIIFLDIFFSKKFSEKEIDIKKLRKGEHTENIIYKANKYGNFLSNYFTGEFKNYFLKQESIEVQKFKKGMMMGTNSLNPKFVEQFKNK